MIRVLHIVSTMDYGGVETLLMSIYRNIDRKKVQFDFLCHNKLECKFKDEIEELGGHVYMVPGPKHVGFIKYRKILLNFFHEHNEFKIIHVHLNNRNGEIIWHAATAGIPIRISHSHISGVKYGLVLQIYRLFGKFLNNKYSTHRLACSKEAGKYLFGNRDFTILPNAINTKRFIFSKDKRIILRKKLNVIDTEILFGHVGRFVHQKNHDFILKIFKECLDSGIKGRLLLIGGGELESSIRQIAKQLDINNKIIFGGEHSELGEYYSAMDVFLFPSLYEGLGIVAVEAQCSGLPVIASTEVPTEAKITDNMYFLSLNQPLFEWINVIKSIINNRINNREQYQTIVNNSIYCIDKIINILQELYVSSYNNV